MSRKEQIRAIIDDAKAVPCVDCGQEFPPCAMDLDHRADEEKCVYGRRSFSSWARSVSIQRLIDEVAKCDARCACCHRIKTAQEQAVFA
jgi:hypothetical protein